MEKEKKKFVVAVSYTVHVEAMSDAEAFREAMYESPNGSIKNLQMRVVAAIPLKQEQPAQEQPVPPELFATPAPEPEPPPLVQTAAAPDSDIPF